MDKILTDEVKDTLYVEASNLLLKLINQIAIQISSFHKSKQAEKKELAKSNIYSRQNRLGFLNKLERAIQADKTKLIRKDLFSHYHSDFVIGDYDINQLKEVETYTRTILNSGLKKDEAIRWQNVANELKKYMSLKVV